MTAVLDDSQASPETRESRFRVTGKLQFLRSKGECLRRHLRKLRSKKSTNSFEKAASSLPQVNQTRLALDGSTELLKKTMPFQRNRLGGDICAIFVHAGAGYHSVQNEEVHLRACAELVAAAPYVVPSSSSRSNRKTGS